MKKYILIIPALVLLFLLKNAIANEIKEEELIFKRLNISEFKLKANLIPAQKITFHNENQWNDFWTRYGSGIEPKIDFDKYIVVGIFLGEKPSPGYGVEITKVRKARNEIIVEFIEYLPNPDLGYPGVLVYPYDIVYFPRTEGNVVFTGLKKVRN